MHYLDKQKFKQHVLAAQKPDATEEERNAVGRDFLLLITHILKGQRLYYEDFFSIAVLHCWQALHKFRADGNAFGYFTSVAKNSKRQIIYDIKRRARIKGEAASHHRHNGRAYCDCRDVLGHFIKYKTNPEPKGQKCCVRCKEIKHLAEYRIDIAYSGERDNTCKICRAEMRAALRNKTLKSPREL